MNQRRLLLASAFVAGCVALCGSTARAHEFKLDALINAFVKIEPGEAQLVVRVPLYLFKSAKFPVNNVEIDVEKSAPAVERALAAIRQDITFFEDGHPLMASHATGRLSLPSSKRRATCPSR